MKKIFVVLLLVGLVSSLARAAGDQQPCGYKLINVADTPMQLIGVDYKSEQTIDGMKIKGREEALFAGIYMFVRNGQVWNVYRCADDLKRDKHGNPRFNPNKCVLKNDFQFGNLVQRYGNSGITVRKTDADTLQVKLNVAGADELDYYDVKAAGEGLEVIRNKYEENKQQRYLSGHKRQTLGTCTKAGLAGDKSQGAGQVTGGKGSAPKKANTSN